MQNNHTENQQSILSQNKVYAILTNYVHQFESLIFIFYSVIVFFKQVIGDQQHLVTATIGTINLQSYCMIQTFLMILLGMLKFREEKRFWNKSICATLASAIVAFNLLYLISGIYIEVGLIIRPIFIAVYSRAGRIAMKYFFIVFYRNLYYFGLMWFSLFIFASIGTKLYGNIEFPDDYNFFTNLSDTMFSLLVMQTTANYPDVGLPYFRAQKSNGIFFIIIMVINTMLIANIIIANSYNNYKNIVQQEENQSPDSIFYLIYAITLRRLEKEQEKQCLINLPAWQKQILKFLQSKFYVFALWLSTLGLFFLICFDNKKQAVQYENYLLIVLNVIILVDLSIKFSIYKFHFWRSYKFQIYGILASSFTILAYILTLVNLMTRQIYSQLIILQLPQIIQYVTSHVIIFTHSIVRFLKRLKIIALMLFIISLLFAGVGEICFGGVLSINIQTTLIEFNQNPNYIYMNFNNTLNSFYTLFALLIVNNWNNIVNVYTELIGSSTPRIFFVLYYIFGVQISYNIFLASIINHLIDETQRFKIQHCSNTQKHQINLKYRKTTNKFFEYLIEKLKYQYKYTHKELHYIEMPECFSQNYPQLIMREQMFQKKNAFSLIYYRRICVQECCFEAITKIETKQMTPQIKQLNSIINQYTQMNETWQIFSVKQIFQREEINCADKQEFQKNVQAKLKQFNLVTGESNKVRALMRFYLEIEEKNHIYYIDYDIPFGYCINKLDLYIDGYRIAFSFYYKAYQQIFLIQKFKLKRMSEIYGRLEKNFESDVTF